MADHWGGQNSGISASQLRNSPAIHFQSKAAARERRRCNQTGSECMNEVPFEEGSTIKGTSEKSMEFLGVRLTPAPRDPAGVLEVPRG